MMIEIVKSNLFFSRGNKKCNQPHPSPTFLKKYLVQESDLPTALNAVIYEKQNFIRFSTGMGQFDQSRFFKQT